MDSEISHQDRVVLVDSAEEEAEVLAAGVLAEVGKQSLTDGIK